MQPSYLCKGGFSNIKIDFGSPYNGFQAKSVASGNANFTCKDCLSFALELKI